MSTEPLVTEAPSQAHASPLVEPWASYESAASYDGLASPLDESAGSNRGPGSYTESDGVYAGLASPFDESEPQPHGASSAGLEHESEPVLEEFRDRVRRGEWAPALQMAVERGERDEGRLTDLVFAARHPERAGRPVRPDEQAMASEWLQIRESLTRPLLAGRTSGTALDPTMTAEVGDAAAWGHRLADRGPALRLEQEPSVPVAEPQLSDHSGTMASSGAYFEHQSAPPPPIVTKSFSPLALAELPDVMLAKPLVRIETTVPTERILWIIANALANPGPEPGWADRLLVDLVDLPKAGPSATVHVAVFQTVPFAVNETDKLQAFERYCIKQHPTKGPPVSAMTVGEYSVNRWLEDQLLLPAGSISTNAGLPSQMTVGQTANYKVVVYALLPRTIGAVVAPKDQRFLRGFPFARWTLTAEHERMLDSLAREVVRSWHSRRSVTRIVAQGHTDPVGTREYNRALGRNRAEAVAKRLKQLINDAAVSASFPAGVLDQIQYVVETYGEDRPFSRTLHTLNRRVELTLYRDHRPPPNPLDQDITITRQTDLLKTLGARDPEAVKRLQCLLQKMRQPGVDDRYVNDTQVFLIKRDNAMPTATEWNRVRSTLLDPRLFSPQVPDDRIVANLDRLDEDIAGGIVKMNQIIAYASGAEWGLGLMALPTAFKQFNAWVMERFKDQSSIYSCYADLFL